MNFTHVSHQHPAPAMVPISARAKQRFVDATGLPDSVISPVVMMNRDLALKLDEYQMAEQRDLNHGKVSDYSAQILSGQFSSPTSIRIAVLPDGVILKYDGQHRIKALLMATDPKQSESDPDACIPVTFTTHDAPNRQHVVDVDFAKTDHAMSVRSKRDIAKAAGLPKDFCQPVGILTAMYAAKLAVERKLILLPATHSKHRDPAQWRDALQDAREFMDFYYPMALRMKEDGTKARAFSKVTRNSALLSVMYFLWCHAEDREVFKTFFTRLCTDSAPDLNTYPHGDPINRLISLLSHDNVLQYGTNLPKWTFPVSEAWNAFVKGRSLRSQLKLTPKTRDADYTMRKFYKTVAKRGIQDWRERGL